MSNPTDINKLINESSFDNFFKETISNLEKINKLTDNLVKNASQIKFGDANSIKEFQKLEKQAAQNQKAASEGIKKTSELQKQKIIIEREILKNKQQENKVDIESEKINTQKAKTQQQIIKNKQEDQKLTQQSLKTKQQENKLIQEEIKNEIQLKKIEQENLKTEQQSIKLQQQKFRLEQQEAKEKARINKQTAREVELNKSASDSLLRKNEELRKLVKEYNSASAAQRTKLAPAIKNLQSEVNKANEAIGRSQGFVGQYGRAFNGLKNIIGKGLGFLGITAGVGAVVQGLKKSVDAFKIQEQAVKNTDIVFGTYSKTIQEAASDTQKLTTVGDEAFLKLAVQAKNFNIEQDKIVESTQGAIGLAEKFSAAGLSQETALKGIANALAGNFSQLERYIPELRTAQTDSEKLAILQKEMKAGFDLATEAATSQTGKLQQISNVVGDVREKIGGLVLKGISPLINNFSLLINKLDQYVAASPVDEIEREREEVLRLTSIIQDNNSTREEQEKALRVLNRIAPEIAENVDLETKSYESLNKALDIYLENTIRKIALANLEKEREEELSRIADLRLKQVNQLIQAQSRLVNVSDEFRVKEGTLQEQIEGTIKNLREYVTANGSVNESRRIYNAESGTYFETLTNEASQLASLEQLLRQNEEIQLQINDANEKSIKPIQNQISVLEELLFKVDDGDKKINQIIEKNKTFIERVVLGENPEDLLIEFDELIDESLNKVESFTNELNKLGETNFKKLNDDAKVFAQLQFEQSKKTLQDQLELIETRRDAELLNTELTENQRKLIIQKAENEITQIQREQEQERLNIFLNRVQTSQTILNAAAQSIANLQQSELTRAEGNAEKQKEIEKKYADVQFGITSAQIVANTAGAIIRQYKDLDVVSATITSALIGGVGLTQLLIANAERQRVQNLAVGGYVDKSGLIVGDSHSDPSGGVPLTSIMTEGDEAASIYSRGVSKKYGSDIYTYWDALNNGSGVVDMAKFNKVKFVDSRQKDNQNIEALLSAILLKGEDKYLNIGDKVVIVRANGEKKTVKANSFIKN